MFSPTDTELFSFVYSVLVILMWIKHFEEANGDLIKNEEKIRVDGILNVFFFFHFKHERHQV